MRLVRERRQLQAQALAAAQEAAHAGRPLQRGRDSSLSRASTVPISRSPSQEYYTGEDDGRAWPPAHHQHQRQHQYADQQQQPPLTPAVAVPLAPLPGQSSHLSVSPAPSNLPPAPYRPAGLLHQPMLIPTRCQQPSHYTDDGLWVHPSQRPPSPFAPRSEDELLWLRMQEERERVLQRQALGEPGAGGYGEDGESVMDFRL